MATILVVDDDAGVRNFVRLALGDTGHEVLEAGDGADGLRQARGGAIDLVLCDLFLPGTGGSGDVCGRPAAARSTWCCATCSCRARTVWRPFAPCAGNVPT